MRAERGPAPGDLTLFEDATVPTLRVAVSEMSWLLSRAYPEAASLKLVGDRYALTARQRKAVQRCACSDASRDGRITKRLPVDSLSGAGLSIDGFNCIIVIESLLSGAPVFRGRDGALRDLAGVHGTWRQLGMTKRVLSTLGAVLTRAGASPVRWWLDRPVSNSGRLRALLLELAVELHQDWSVELVDDPDRVLINSSEAVATADAWILDSCESWVDLPQKVAETVPSAWIIDLA